MKTSATALGFLVMSNPDRPDRIIDIFRMADGYKPIEVTPTSVSLPQTELGPAHTIGQQTIDLVRNTTRGNRGNRIAKAPRVRGRRMGSDWHGA